MDRYRRGRSIAKNAFMYKSHFLVYEREKPSLASHTLRREKGSGDAATIELLPKNAIIEHSSRYKMLNMV